MFGSIFSDRERAKGREGGIFGIFDNPWCQKDCHDRIIKMWLRNEKISSLLFRPVRKFYACWYGI